MLHVRLFLESHEFEWGRNFTWLELGENVVLPSAHCL
jgi:hypothetical protein